MIEVRQLVVFKPECLKRRILGAVLSRYEREGFLLYRLAVDQLLYEFWSLFYQGLESKIPRESYFEHINYMMSGPCVFSVWTGEDVVRRIRLINGPTDPEIADKSTVRGMFGSKLPFNVVHSSDSQESAAREIDLLTREADLNLL